MPRPVQELVTFTLDGREVTAPQNAMLVDAALQYGETEIPVFCYEPKIGPPVGACRMCLVEIEGVPKLQAGCATPVKDGSATPMDLDIMASVQEHIMGNCLCVLGDAMAMPIASMINKFRPEFEQYIEDARVAEEQELLAGVAS